MRCAGPWSMGRRRFHRGLYPLAEQATLAYESARSTLASFVGARSAKEIVFCASATQAIDLCRHRLVAPRIEAGDEICGDANGRSPGWRTRRTRSPLHCARRRSSQGCCARSHRPAWPVPPGDTAPDEPAPSHTPWTAHRIDDLRRLLRRGGAVQVVHALPLGSGEHGKNARRSSTHISEESSSREFMPTSGALDSDPRLRWS